MAHCDFLTATVSVGVDAPSALLANPDIVLPRFYVDPNDSTWNDISRILYHETVHFWQLFSSGYLAKVVLDAWTGLIDFERQGKAKLYANPLTLRNAGQPFSSGQLAECWARFWDVHTRSPDRVRAEDTVEDAVLGRAKPAPSLRATRGYKLAAIDDLLNTTKLDAEYALPFRWLLEQSGFDSNFTHATFPHICHFAFATPDPVGSFTAAAQLGSKSAEVRNRVDRAGISQSQDVNRVWLTIGNDMSALFFRVMLDLRLPGYTSGLDIIQRSELRQHPVYSHYVQRVNRVLREIAGTARLLSDASSQYARDMRFAASYPWGAFCLPGQPTFRSVLGQYLQPARIRFSNGEVLAKLSGPVFREVDSDPKDTFEGATAALDDRIERYRAALKDVQAKRKT